MAPSAALPPVDLRTSLLKSFSLRVSKITGTTLFSDLAARKKKKKPKQTTRKRKHAYNDLAKVSVIQLISSTESKLSFLTISMHTCLCFPRAFIFLFSTQRLCHMKEKRWFKKKIIICQGGYLFCQLVSLLLWLKDQMFSFGKAGYTNWHWLY